MKEIPLAEGVHTIGRAPENTIPLMNMTVSRWHARLEVKGNVCTIRDQESGGGIFLNDARVTAAQVQEKDRLQIGEMSLELEWEKKSVVSQKFSVISVLAWLLVVAIIAGGYYCRGHWATLFSRRAAVISPDFVSAKAVEVVGPQKRTFTCSWEGMGEIRFNPVPVYVDSAVPIKKILIEPGDEVAVNEEIASVDRELWQKRLDEAQNALSAATTLEDLYKKMMEQLAARDSVDKKIAYVEAEIDYRKCKSQRETLSANVANLKQQEKSLKIRAPVAGIVAQTMESRNPLAVLLDKNEVYAITWISETDAQDPKLQKGKRAEVFSETLGSAYLGKVEQIGKVLRPSDKTVELKVKLQGVRLFDIPLEHREDLRENRITQEIRDLFEKGGQSLSSGALVERSDQDGESWIRDRNRKYLYVAGKDAIAIYLTGESMAQRLMEGSAVRMKILLDERVDALSVPKRALCASASLRREGPLVAVLSPESPYLYIVDEVKTQEGKTEGKARKIPVSLGYSDEEFCEILDPQPIDSKWIIVKGQLTISDGDPVEMTQK